MGEGGNPGRGDRPLEQWRDDRWNVGIVVRTVFGIPADKAIIDIEDDSPEGKVAILSDTLLKGPAWSCIHQRQVDSPLVPMDA